MELRLRRFFLLRFTALLYGAFFVYTGLFWALAVRSPDREERRALELDQQSRLSQALLERNATADLVENLRHGVRTGQLDFFGWRKDGAWLSTEGVVPEYFRPVPEDEIRNEGDFLVARVESSGHDLYLGVRSGPAAELRSLWRNERLPLVKDLLLLLLGFGVVVFVLFRDLARARRGNSAEWKEPRAVPAPKVLRAAVSAGDEEPGGEGSGVFGLARFPEGDLTARYAEVEGLVARYGGRALGVERGTIRLALPEDPNLALAAARDLFALGASVALARGTSEALDLGAHRAYAGPVWDECDALLRPGRLVASASLGASETSLFRLREGMLVDSLDAAGARRAARTGRPELLGYFRADEALRLTLEELAADGWSNENYLGSIRALRSFQCRDAGAGFAAAYAALLAAELAHADPYRLSATLALAPHLLAPGAVSAELERLFLEALGRPGRPRANAVEVLIHFFPDREFGELKLLARDPDNRVSANVLIKQALERFDERLVHTLEARLKGGSVAHVASALYAIGEIASYYRRTDPLYLATKTGFLALFEPCPKLALHPNPMVRRQALHAARKLGDQNLDARLRQLCEECEEEELKELFASIYGWRKEERRAA